MGMLLRWSFGALALAGLLLALAAHLTAWAGADPFARWPWLWLLHAGIFVLVLPIAFLEYFGKSAPRPASWPRRIAFGVALAYTLGNFFWCALQMGEGRVEERGGRQVLVDRGREVRALGAAEVQARAALGARLFSGHWLLFYGLAAGYYLRRRP